MSVEEIEKLYEQIRRVSLGDELKVLQATLFVLGIASALKELNSETRPVLVALSAVAIGINYKESATGLLPEGLIKLANATAQGLVESVSKKENGGSRRLLALFLQLVFAIVMIVPVMVIENEDDLLSFDLMLQMLLTAKVFETIGQKVVEACGATQNQKEASELITLLSLLLTIYSVSRIKRSMIEGFIESVSTYLKGLLENTSSFVNEMIREGNVENPLAKDANVAIQQGLLALEKSEYETFFEVIRGLIAKLELEETDLEGYDARLKTFARLMKKVFASHESVTAETGIMQG